MPQQQVPQDLCRGIRRGADELNLVRSGLDDTMRTAYQDIGEVYRSRDDTPDPRAAAYVLAIEKIARYYVEVGM
jgi:glutamate dehydrogenase (NAD(P)+)